MMLCRLLACFAGAGDWILAAFGFGNRPMRAPLTLGIVMLHTRFPRPLGDIGNPASFNCPTLFETVPSATPGSVITPGNIDPAVVADMIAAARRLIARGATLITTSCGFVCSIHEQIAAAIDVPLVSSALNLAPVVAASWPCGPMLVLTFDGRVLSRSHFGRFWVDNLVIQGIEQGSELHPVIKHDRTEMDLSRACADVLEAAATALAQHPNCAAIMLECTNLPPYRQALMQRFGLPVFDVFSALEHVAAEHFALGVGIRAASATHQPLQGA
jgi:Asp/Glu/hydantoin racemase